VALAGRAARLEQAERLSNDYELGPAAQPFTQEAA